MISFGLQKAPVRTFTSAKTLEPIDYSDGAVRIALIQLSLDPDVDAIEFIPTVEISGTEISIAAIIVVRDGAKWLLDLIDVRPIAELDEIGLRLLATEKLGLPPLTVSSKELNGQPYADNCRLVWLCQSEHVSAGDRVRLLQSLTEEGSMSLANAAEECRAAADPVSAVLSLVCSNLLEADLKDTPLGPETRIRRRNQQGGFR